MNLRLPAGSGTTVFKRGRGRGALLLRRPRSLPGRATRNLAVKVTYFNNLGGKISGFQETVTPRRSACAPQSAIVTAAVAGRTSPKGPVSWTPARWQDLPGPCLPGERTRVNSTCPSRAASCTALSWPRCSVVEGENPDRCLAKPEEQLKEILRAARQRCLVMARLRESRLCGPG